MLFPTLSGSARGRSPQVKIPYDICIRVIQSRSWGTTRIQEPRIEQLDLLHLFAVVIVTGLEDIHFFLHQPSSRGVVADGWKLLQISVVYDYNIIWFIFIGELFFHNFQFLEIIGDKSITIRRRSVTIREILQTQKYQVC